MVKICIFLSMGCGGTPGSDAVDSGSGGAYPSDADICECLFEDPLSRGHIQRTHFTEGPMSLRYGGQARYCWDIETLVGGSCEEERFDFHVRIIHAGVHVNPRALYQGWGCGWRDLLADEKQITITNRTICLNPRDLEQEKLSNPECDCPPVHPLVERIVRIERSATLKSNQYGQASARCQEDSVLINGGCSLTGPYILGWQEKTLSRSGFSPGTANSWQCAWNNPNEYRQAMLATAICLEPPDYGPDLARGRIVRASRQQVLSSGEATTFTASCEPGDLLIGGSCMIDSNDPLSHQITMFYYGVDSFEDGNHDRTTSNTWRCAWHNPSTSNPMATATAICVTPLQ